MEVWTEFLNTCYWNTLNLPEASGKYLKKRRVSFVPPPSLLPIEIFISWCTYIRNYTFSNIGYDIPLFFFVRLQFQINCFKISVQISMRANLCVAAHGLSTQKQGELISLSIYYNSFPYLLTYLLTYLVTHSLHGARCYLKTDCHWACQKIPHLRMEPEGSLPCSQKPAIGSYPEPGVSSLPHRSLSP
jgi:hypothetical protein